MTKKVVSLLLTVSMLVSVLAGLETAVSAAYSGADGVYQWDFAEYTTEVAGAAGSNELVVEDYNGLTVSIIDNKTGSDYDKISTAGVYWRGGAASGETTRYIAYTPDENGILYATGKLNSTKGRWGISASLDVSSFAADHTSTTNTSVSTVYKECVAGQTYYIYAKAKAAVVNSIKYVTDSATPEPSIAAVLLNNIYGDNMLLQRNKPIALDGTVHGATSAKITLKNNNDPADVQEKIIGGLSDGGTWNATLDAVSNHTDPYTLTIEPGDAPEGAQVETTVVENILFGDLYLCGGQSNMWYYLKTYYDAKLDYTEEEIANCGNSNIRILQLPTPDEDPNVINRSQAQNSLTLDADWQELSTDFALNKYLPATVYSLATRLYQETNVPIGILSTAVGATQISQWRTNTGSDSYNSNKNWYNTRIYPFRNLAISGVFWYQGCSDKDHPASYYTKAMTGLIKEYRELFADQKLPFYYVQLTRNANVYPDTVSKPGDDNTGMRNVRQAQTDAYLNMGDKTNLGFISTLDIYGEKKYIPGKNSNFSARVNYHTAQKPLIANRLADLALHDIYGKNTHTDGSPVYTSGPLYRSHYADRDRLVVEFDCNGDLKVMEEERYSDDHSAEVWAEKGIDPSKIQEFEIAGADGQYYPASASLEANKVILTSESVSEPVMVRYAYAAYPECPNLTDESNLPAYAFVAEAPANQSWRFDFGGGEAADGWIKVDKDCQYSSQKGYGFLGTSKESAAYSAVVDGYQQTEDTLTVLENGGISSHDTNSDYVLSPKKNHPVRFALKVTPNSYYKVKVTMGNGGQDSKVTLTSERRHLVLTEQEIKAGQTLTKEFTVAVHDVKWKNRESGKPVPTEYTDDMLNIGVIGENACINTLEIQKIERPKVLWLFGDSTVCDAPAKVPYNGFDTAAGWGQAMAKYISDDVAVVNLAEGGLSTGDTSYFAVGASDIRQGDVVLMQMGHNENSVSKYKAGLDYYKNIVQNAGATFVLCSPIERLTQGQMTMPWPHTELYTDYAPAAKEYTRADNSPYIDLNQLTYDLNNELGTVRPWYLHSVYWDGTAKEPAAFNDATHTNDYGADNNCRMVAEQIKKLSVAYPALTGYIKDTLEQPIMPSDELMKAGTADYVMPPLRDNEEYFPMPPSSGGISGTKKYMHMSFDDVYSCLLDITNKKDIYASVFENNFLGGLKSLHETYGAVFTLNCFNQYSKNKAYNISNLPEKYQKELAQNADWLKFSFHAQDDLTNYGDGKNGTNTSGTVKGDCVDEIKQSYNQFTNAVLKATGTENAIDRVARLGFFAGTENNVKALQECEHGIEGLLTADDARISYYLSQEANDAVVSSGKHYDTEHDLMMLKSQVRLENVKDTASTLAGLKAAETDGINFLEVFTHEQSYTGSVPARLDSYLKWAVENGYEFTFAQEVLDGLKQDSPKSLYQWNFDTADQISYKEGINNIPVLSGDAQYSQSNRNIVFSALNTANSKVSINLSAPAKELATVEFDMNVGKVNGQKISYTLSDEEGAPLVYCQLHPQSGSTETDGLRIGGIQAAPNSKLCANIARVDSDGMSASTTHFKNEINFSTGEVIVTISSDSTDTGVYTGTLQNTNTKSIKSLQFTASKISINRPTYLDNISISQAKLPEVIEPSPPPAGGIDTTVIVPAAGDTTVVDTSDLIFSNNITSYLVTTSKAGKKVAQSKVAKSQSVTVDSKGADKIEVSPVYRYTNIGSCIEPYPLSDTFEDGRYDMTFKKSSSKRGDLYVNGYMVGNNVDQVGLGRTNNGGAEYAVKDIKIEGGKINVTAKDFSGSDTSGGSLSWIEIVKSPSIVDRAAKVFVLGDSLVANMYGSFSSDLGTGQTGWGQSLSNYITSDVLNLANSGQTAKDLYETAFGSVLYHAQEGDLFILESGYNDFVKSTEEEMTQAVSEMVDKALRAKLVPVLVSPNANSAEAYSAEVRFGSVMKNVAEKKGVAFVDLAKRSYDYLYGLYKDDVSAVKENFNVSDGVHTSYAGSMKYAEFIAQAVYDLGYKDIVNTEFTYSVTDKKGNKIFCQVAQAQEPGRGNKIINVDGRMVTVWIEDKDAVLYSAKYNNASRLDSVERFVFENTGAQTVTLTKESDKLYLWSSNMEPYDVYWFDHDQ